MTTRTGLYLRISQDRTGAQAGIDRQRDECLALAKQQGLTVIGEYVDNDISAYSGKPRPEWRRLLKDLREGSLDGIVSWHADRLYRRLRDLTELMDIVNGRNILIATVMSSEIDLSTASGRMMASILGSVAEAESAQKSERIRAQRNQAALKGQWSGSQRSFGYTTNMQIVPSEAEVIRELARRLLSGDSLRSVTFDLISRDVPTVRGGTWRTATVKSMMCSAKMSGQREHTPAVGNQRGRAYGRGNIVSKGQWDAILTPDETERLRARFAIGLVNSPATPRLLTGGLVRCGRCGSPLNSRTATDGSGWRYACIRMPGRQETHCGRLSVVGEAVNAVVEGQLLAAIGATPVVRGQQAQTRKLSSDEAKASAMQKRLAHLLDDYIEGNLSRQEYLRMKSKVDAAMSRLGSAQPDLRAALTGLPREPELLRRTWDQIHVDRKRAVVRALIEQVTVTPATVRGRPTFDPDRVSIVWLP